MLSSGGHLESPSFGSLALDTSQATTSPMVGGGTCLEIWGGVPPAQVDLGVPCGFDCVEDLVSSVPCSREISIDCARLVSS